MQLGGSGNAFTEDVKTCDCHEKDEYQCDCPTEFGQAIENWEDEFNVEAMLKNLDESPEEIQEMLVEDGQATVTQFFGGRITIDFEIYSNRVIATVDGLHKKPSQFEVTNLDAS